MKYFTFILALATSFGGSYAYANDVTSFSENTSGLKWTTDYSTASQLAKIENKPIFLCFTGSDWCPWSKKMHSEILLDPHFQQLVADKLIFVTLDFPRNSQQNERLKKHNQKLYEQYHIKSLSVGKNRGFPAVIILDPNGNKIAELGYQTGGGALYAQKVLNIIESSKF